MVWTDDAKKGLRAKKQPRPGGASARNRSLDGPRIRRPFATRQGRRCGGPASSRGCYVPGIALFLF